MRNEQDWKTYMEVYRMLAGTTREIPVIPSIFDDSEALAKKMGEGSGVGEKDSL